MSTTRALVQAKTRTKRLKAVKISPRPPLPGTDDPAYTNHRIDDQQKYMGALELTWEEFKRGYALPNMHNGVDPLSQQRDIR